MDLDDGIEDDLRERTREMIDHEVLGEENAKPSMKHKSGEMDEKIEREALSETGASWNPEQIEFLVRQRTSMDNEELQEFLAGDHDARKELRSWEPFTRTEEKFLMQNLQTESIEEIAASIDRKPEQVELQIKIMGLDHLIE